MAREIKFRAYNKNFGMTEDVIIMDGSYTDDLIGDNWRSGEIMQFIGLRDRNNKDIYEGDIVKWGDLVTSNEITVRIATVQLDPDIQFHRINRNSKDIYHWATFFYGSDQLKVIGNIYENPEILKLYNATT